MRSKDAGHPFAIRPSCGIMAAVQFDRSKAWELLCRR
jgi:hypothetical protein